MFFNLNFFLFELSLSAWIFTSEKCISERRVESFPLTLSIGAAFYPSAGLHDMEIVNCARSALHASKKLGGNCVTMIPSSPPDVALPPAPGPPIPSFIDPPGMPPALSPGYEQSPSDDDNYE